MFVPDTHHYFNREVRHSLTWHSSESESALKRFEPVAVVCCSRTVGALCSHWSPRGDRVSFQRERNALFDDFWYFSSLKSTIRNPPHILTKSGFRAW